MFGHHDKTVLPLPEQALPGSDTPMPVSNRHFVNGHPIQPPFPDGMRQALFGMVCSGLTGHNEVVLVIWDPTLTTYLELLKVFWESHDPTQGMRQGNDVGTQYRSGIYTFDPQQDTLAHATLATYQQALDRAGRPRITTEILPAPAFYYAEDFHQQYLAKNPNGYCGLGGCGIPLDK